jgi:3-oxoadipate enol-lactonase
MAKQRLDAEVRGEGPDVLLLHSLLSDRSSFLPLGERLARCGRRVHLVDLPGFGASPSAVPLAGYADALADYWAELDLGKADLIGNGLGSFVALTAAARHGARIGRLVLLGCAIAFPEQGRATFRGLADKVEREGMAAVADIAMARMFSEDFISANPTVVARRREIFLGIDPVAFAAAARALSTVDLSADLKSIRHRVLIVAGEKDGATPPALGRALAESLSQGEFVELKGVGHAPHIQALDPTLATIAPFLGLSEPARG